MEKLGQNFLINKNIARKIVESANLTPDDFVLEIGPGKGILTEELVKVAGKVVAVEIDKSLIKLLRNKFSNNKNVKVIREDILKINLTKLLTTNNSQLLRSEAPKYKVVANLPYYITSPIIRMFLEAELLPTEMILMVQKEVAERITAKPGQMSILAVSVQYYAQPEILFNVGRENFDPVPEVDSAVIRITPSPPAPLPKRGEGEVEKRFFRIVRAGFCARRKTLANNLANSFHLDKKEVEEKLKAAGLPPITRAQELSVNDWKKLAGMF